MKVAVITGATSGIGNNLLKNFLNDGYTVFAGYRDVRQKKNLVMLSDRVIPFRIDLTKKWTIDEAIKTINESTDKIDVLINAAGKVTAGPLEHLSVDKIREQFEVNTFAHLELAQGLFAKLDGGKIINISSMASYGLFPFIAPYCASKKALDMLFNSLRIETGSKVKIISVKPGVIATPLWKKAVDENRENLGSGKYKVVADYLISNAMKNETDGLDSEKVAKKILKIANTPKPKTSYVIGVDAVGARLVSKFPQKLIDIIVEHQLVKRVKAQLKEIVMISSQNDVKVREDIEVSENENTSINTEKNENIAVNEAEKNELSDIDILFEPETDFSISEAVINEKIKYQIEDENSHTVLEEAIDSDNSKDV